jgi:hypothetical protein
MRSLLATACLVTFLLLSLAIPACAQDELDLGGSLINFHFQGIGGNQIEVVIPSQYCTGSTCNLATGNAMGTGDLQSSGSYTVSSASNAPFYLTANSDGTFAVTQTSEIQLDYTSPQGTLTGLFQLTSIAATDQNGESTVVGVFTATSGTFAQYFPNGGDLAVELGLTGSLASLVGHNGFVSAEFQTATIVPTCPFIPPPGGLAALSTQSAFTAPVRQAGHSARNPLPDTNYKWNKAKFEDKAYEPVFDQMTPSTTEPEIEETIAADQAVPKNLVAAVIDNSENYTPKRPNIAYARSDDDGKSWGAAQLLPRNGDGYFQNKDKVEWVQAVDPALAIDKQTHNVYLSRLHNNGADRTQDPPKPYYRGIYVGAQQFGNLQKTGFVGAQTYTVATYPVTVNQGQAKVDAWPDRPGVAVDNSYPNSTCKGNVYVGWLHVVVGADPAKGKAFVRFAVSTNQGMTWTTTTKDIAGPFDYPDKVPNGVQIAVGPAAEGKPAPVYVAYDLEIPGNLEKKPKDGQIIVHTSTNCDKGKDMTFDQGTSVTGKDTFSDLFALNFAGANYRLDSWPSMAVSPTTGTVAVVWPACTVMNSATCDGGDGSEVLFSARKKGAAAFSAPVIINEVSMGQQFFPAIAADACGTFHASWLDSRDPGTVLMPNVFATYTKNEGASFSHNFMVNTGKITIDQDYVTIGDYTGIAARDGHAYPVWSSGGVFGNNAGKGTIQTRTITVPAK